MLPGGSYCLAVRPSMNSEYTDAVRLAFIRAHGVDPIDVPAPNILLGFDIEQPFFLDDFLGPMNNGPGQPNPAMQKMPDLWLQYRAEMNLDAIKRLLGQFGDISIPMLVQPPDGGCPRSNQRGQHGGVVGSWPEPSAVRPCHAKRFVSGNDAHFSVQRGVEPRCDPQHRTLFEILYRPDRYRCLDGED